MRRIAVVLAMTVLMGSFVPAIYASDWDKAGKILTGIAGLRILTGGKIDLIGSIAGTDNDKHHRQGYSRRTSRKSRYKHHAYGYDNSYGRARISHPVWERAYVPVYTEYYPAYGEVIVIESHYIKSTAGRGHLVRSQCPRDRNYRHRY